MLLEISNDLRKFSIHKVTGDGLLESLVALRKGAALFAFLKIDGSGKMSS